MTKLLLGVDKYGYFIKWIMDYNIHIRWLIQTYATTLTITSQYHISQKALTRAILEVFKLALFKTVLALYYARKCWPWVMIGGIGLALLLKAAEKD